MNKRFWLFGLLALVSLFKFSACSDDPVFLKDPSAQLTLRSDTLFFDTVFTANSPRIPASVNKQFIVVNPHNKSVTTDFRLAGGENSVFRINVDGEVGPVVNNVEIRPNDSVFVFVELSIDPNNDPQSLPLIVRDSVVVNTNGNDQNVQLIAWGQDAHYFLRDTLCSTVLSDKEKPYVVYGYLYVPENCNLTIREGVQLHFAPGAWLYVEGTLTVLGTKDEPVKFEGDRLQPSFEEIPGQWGGIWIDRLSTGNRIRYAEIKNGTVGIYCDSSLDLNQRSVTVENTMVRNMSFDGLSGKRANIQATNSIFANCGRYSFLGLWGGVYDLKHCNFITYNYYFGRKDPTFALNNVQIDEFFRVVGVYDLAFNIQNCIIEGSLEDEVSFGLVDPDSILLVEKVFDDNMVRLTDVDATKTLKGFGKNNVVNTGRPSLGNIFFEDYRKHNYHLKMGALPIDSGATDLGINVDFEGNSRDGMPDIGAFEFQ